MGHCIGRCCDDDDPPFGLIVCPFGCGCGCYDPDVDAIPYPGQSAVRVQLCNFTVTIKSGATVVATCTAADYPCACCKFTGLDPGTYTIEITHADYLTLSESYTYVPLPTADRQYRPTMCQSHGHCIGCTQPIGDTVTLDIVRDADFLISLPGGAIGPIPTAGLSIGLTYGEIPADWLPGSYVDRKHWWYGSTTVPGQVGELTCGGYDRTCDAAGSLIPTDCSRVTYVDADIPLAFLWRQCYRYFQSPCYSPGFYWDLWMLGPPILRCLKGTYCTETEFFFASDVIGAQTICGVSGAVPNYSAWQAWCIPAPVTCGPSLNRPASPQFGCNPLALDFRPALGFWSSAIDDVWGTITKP
jgi:hypothetical protein